jgi:hypothetical protein
MKKIVIVADTNDGDYVSKISNIDDETLELIKPLIEKIKKLEPYIGEKPDYWQCKHSNNFPTGDCCREDLGEKTIYELYGDTDIVHIFEDEFVPHGEYGIHTIKSVTILEVINEEILL